VLHISTSAPPLSLCALILQVGLCRAAEASWLLEHRIQKRALQSASSVLLKPGAGPQSLTCCPSLNPFEHAKRCLSSTISGMLCDLTLTETVIRQWLDWRRQRRMSFRHNIGILTINVTIMLEFTQFYLKVTPK